jgi:hypothetical protein
LRSLNVYTCCALNFPSDFSIFISWTLFFFFSSRSKKFLHSFNLIWIKKASWQNFNNHKQKKEKGARFSCMSLSKFLLLSIFIFFLILWRECGIASHRHVCMMMIIEKASKKSCGRSTVKQKRQQWIISPTYSRSEKIRL